MDKWHRFKVTTAMDNPKQLSWLYQSKSICARGGAMQLWKKVKVIIKEVIWGTQ